MSRSRWMMAGVACFSLLGLWLGAAEVDRNALRQKAQKAEKDGNFKNAWEDFQKLALDPQDDPGQVSDDLTHAIQCLRQLNRIDEVDEFREKVITAHKANWRLLKTAASTYLHGDSYGFVIAGKFYRGHRRGEGRYVYAMPRDRIRALQLFVQALPLADQDPDKASVAQFYLEFADAWQAGGHGNQAWRLQILTDLKELPDLDDVRWMGGDSSGAPVDAEGNPVYHQLPAKYADAKSDGERWRWALFQVIENAPARKHEVNYKFAEFLRQQLDVQTMAQYNWFFRGHDDQTEKTPTYQLDTLGEDESLAKLATGIKRFKLPAEFNFIKQFRTIAQESKDQWGRNALHQLANIFTDRRQYPKAAAAWQQAIAQFSGDQGEKEALNQIVKNWGRFDHATVFPAGKGPELQYVFRNGKHVDFEAWEIKVPQLIDDIKAYLKGDPNRLDWNQINVQGIGHRLVFEQDRKYLGPRVAQWSLDLSPRPNHFDRRVTVATPLQKAGAYLVTGKLADGNVSRIIVWVADTVIAKKPLDKQVWYYVADAVTGKPVPKTTVEFFGWKSTQVNNTNRYRVTTSNFAEKSDADGQIMLAANRLNQDFQWMAITRGEAEKRFAYLGFSGVWYADRQDQEYNEVKVFSITDRPVYRPAQPVKFKFWVRHAKYDQPDKSDYANQEYRIVINNPLGEEVFNKTLTTDAYAGLEGEYSLPKDAKLGSYSIQLQGGNFGGGGSFRVEEYKKPEFEVTVEAPQEPVQLGDKITATINAKYYFGAPVVNAKVKYKVMRSKHTEQWHPVGKWDWFYGRGYWWFAYDYAWYPGWKSWGCVRPFPFWWPRNFDPPEMVVEREVEIGADGKVQVEIDTAVAKAMHPNDDHSYSIQAEVVDQSRRTIVGNGNVLVARAPYRVFAWVNRGHYLTGDQIEASFSAHTLDRKPVKGTGTLKLLKLSYNEKREPVETQVETWGVNTNDEGYATQSIKAGVPGQYRLSYSLSDTQGHTQEGGYVFVIRGQGFNGAQFRFNDLEIITDKKEYAPGEKIKLLINTDRLDSTVALFLRPANGVYLPPKIIRLQGKSTETEVEVTRKDMPNFFIEAITISSGELYAEAREVVVPPEKRVLNVAVEPSATEYLPGAPAKVKIKLTDLAGKAFQGTSVLTMYDKSVEYISGGSNVPEIKEFFWKWKRHHHPQTESNLNLHFDNLFRQNERMMNHLGIFGESVAQDGEETGEQLDRAAPRGFGGMGGVRNRAMSKSMMMTEGAAPPAPPAAMSALAKDAAAEAPPAGGELVAPTVRKNFADSAFWAGSLTTDADGVAEVALTMPENLTAWKIKTWGMGQGTQVGEGEVEVTTKKNLLVRLQAPRFFIQKDEVVLSANVHNYLKEKKSVKVVLEIDELNGAETTSLEAKVERVAADQRESKTPGWELSKDVEVEAGGELRVDWRVRIDQPGEIIVRMKALTDAESDAMQQQFPVYVHGISKTESFAGVIRPDKESGSVNIKIPAERRINESRIEVRYSPTLAGAMVDALPYLVEFPYGCTEQTLNRFLPTVITQKVLLGMNLDLKAIRDKRTNLNAQEIGDDKERAKRWKRFDREPVFDEAVVQDMVKEGVKTLTEQQCADGGWGWFSGWGEHSWPHTTAVVVHGLQVAKQNDVALVPGVLERGVEWLKNYQADQIRRLKNAPGKVDPWKEHADHLDALVYMVLAEADIVDEEMREFLYRDRNHLSVYAKAVYGIALHKQAQQEKLDMILQNIEQYLVQDEENQTAYLKLPDGNFWWYWFGDEIEANAYYLKLLSRTDGKGERASRLVKYLLNNRKHATYWASTRDTALCIEAMAEFLKASGESKPDLTIEVYVDGQKQKEVKVNAENLFSFDNQFVLLGDAVPSGEHKIELKKKGTGPVYFNAYVTNFTLEDFITKAGLEIKVNRKYYKLIRQDKTTEVAGGKGEVINQKVDKFRREELANLATLKSGDLVEVELEIDSKNDYEYLLFEDLKASGFEPMEVRSGYNGNDMGAYMELRDERVAFFVRALSRGKHSVAYRLRAEIPGKFSALPTRASAMYAPELKANSDEIKLSIED